MSLKYWSSYKISLRFYVTPHPVPMSLPSRTGSQGTRDAKTACLALRARMAGGLSSGQEGNSYTLK